MALTKRYLGSSGLKSTAVWIRFLGSWQRRLVLRLGPSRRRRVYRNDAACVDLRINWIDTAAIYGLGHSEEIVGRLYVIFRSRGVLLFSPSAGWRSESDRMAEPQRTLKPDTIRRECEASLRRLGVERIDLYQFHWPGGPALPSRIPQTTMVKLIRKAKSARAAYRIST